MEEYTIAFQNNALFFGDFPESVLYIGLPNTKIPKAENKAMRGSENYKMCCRIFSKI